MKVEFPQKSIDYLRCIKSEVRRVEETQELRMPDQMPDVDRILCCWGQVLLRSKEWHDGAMTVSGGVMAWVMYMPEGESGIGRMAQAWLPFQTKWDLPPTKHDGMIRVMPLLESVDARTTSARKIVVRANVSLLGEAFVQDQVKVCVPDEVPEGVQLLKRTYPMVLPIESGEKAFEMEEELALPQSAPSIDEILRFSFHPELIDRKVMSGKVVFRGAGLLHILYRSQSGELLNWDFEIPFAQYAQLDTQFEQTAQCVVLPVVTALELDTMADGKLFLKAGISGQYMIYDTALVTVAEDAYSINSEMEIQTDTLHIPSAIALERKTLDASQTLRVQVSDVIDTAFYPWLPYSRRRNDQLQITMSGVFHVLYRDESGSLQGVSEKWQSEETMYAAENTVCGLLVQASGKPTDSRVSGQTVIRGDILMDSIVTAENQIPMICALEVGEKQTPDPNRPNLILQRSNSLTLWELAKQNKSVMEQIRSVNGLLADAEPAPEQMLLIPVV